MSLEPGVKDPDPWAQWLVPNAHSPRLRFYNDIVPTLYKSAHGKIPNFKEYLKTQQKFHWEIKEELQDLHKKIKSLQDDSWGVGYNVTRYKEFPKDPNSGDVGRAELTHKSLLSNSQRLKDAKMKLEKRRENLFTSEPICYDWAKDEVQFIDEQLKAVEDMSNAITKLENGIQNTLSLLKKRFASVDVMESEKKRKKRRQKEMQKKKKKRAQTTAVKQATKILHACDVDKGIIESVIEGKKTVLKLSHFNLVHLKLFPKLHLHWIQYLLKSECLDHEAVDKFKQFESILMVRKNMFSKTDSHQDIEESGVSVGVEVNETNDESCPSTEQESDQD